MEVTIVTATAKTNFIVILELALIWWTLLVVDHFTGFTVRGYGKGLWLSKSLSFSHEERFSEVITIVDAENTVVDCQVHGESQITPVEAFGGFAILRNFVAFKENSLW